MSRSRFSDGVKVDQQALGGSEDFTRFEIQRRFSDTIRPGRAFGGALAIAATAYRFNIGAARGYTERGDFVEFDGQSNVGLVDYTLDVKNFVCLAYREVPAAQEAHELDGTTQSTQILHSVELKVFTEDEYNALSASSGDDFEDNLKNADLTTDARDRLVVLAVVAGKGFTGGTPNSYVAGDFDNGTINQQDFPTTLITASLPTAPTITGVNIKSLSEETNPGTGELWLHGGPGAWRLSWGSPDANGDPNSVTGVDGIVFADSSSSQEITIPSDVGDGSTIVVEAFTPLFAQSGLPLTDSITVKTFYEDDGQTFTAVDKLHRAKTGSYVPTEVNPHGLGVENFVQQVTKIPKSTSFGEDLIDNDTKRLLPRMLTPLFAAALGQRTQLWKVASDVGSNIRFYSVQPLGTSDGHLEIVVNAEYDGTQWVKDSGSLSVTKYVIKSSGVTAYLYSEATTPFAEASFKESWTSGNGGNEDIGAVKLGAGFLTGTDPHKPRLHTNYLGTLETVKVLGWLIESGGPSSASLRVYHHVKGFELTANAKWNGTSYVKDVTANPSYRFTFGSDGFKLEQHTTVVASFTSWDSPAGLTVTPTGALTSGGTIQGASRLTNSGAFENLTSSFKRSAPFSTSLGQRWLVMEGLDSAGVGIGMRQYAYMDVATARWEFAVNCYWDGSNWHSDTSAREAVIFRLGHVTGEFYYQTKDPTAAPWGDANWTTTVTPNDKNLATKAWAQIKFASVAGFEPTLIKGVNVSSSITNPGPYVNVAFSSSVGADPIVMVQDHTPFFAEATIPLGDNTVGGSESKLNGDNTPRIFAVARDITDTGFKMYLYRMDDDGVAQMNTAAGGLALTHTVNFFVFNNV